MEAGPPWESAIEERRLKPIASCDNAFVTDIGAVAVATLHYAFAQNETLLLSLRCTTLSNRMKPFCCRSVSTKLSRKKHLLAREPAAQRQQMFYLCESKATATTTTKRPVGTEINHNLLRRFINCLITIENELRH